MLMCRLNKASNSLWNDSGQLPMQTAGAHFVLTGEIIDQPVASRQCHGTQSSHNTVFASASH